MKLRDRQHVEGTSKPRIYIGHRCYSTAAGQRKTCRTWHAEWSLVAKKFDLPLNTRSKAEAIRRVIDLASRLEDGHMPTKIKRISLEDLIEEYMANQENLQRAPTTLRAYRHALKQFLEFASQRNIRFACTLTERDYWAFGKKLADEGLARKTVYTRLVLVKQLYNWGTRQKFLTENPISSASPKKPPNTPQPCFRPEQVDLLLQRAPVNDTPAYALMAYAGLRIGEVRDLRWTDLLLDQGRHGVIFVQRGGSTGSTKSQRSRRVPICSALRSIIDALPRDSDRVVTQPDSNGPRGARRPVEERNLLMRLKELCRKCGFDNPDQYKLHTFRHAFCSMCARQNVSHKYAQTWMGHRNSEVLDLYYTMYDDVAADAIETIDYSGRQSGVAQKLDVAG